MREKSYTKIEAWKKAHELAIAIYKVTNDYPKSELYGLVSQLRRAALSVPTNIVEGFARRNQKVFNTFLDTTYGSLVEVDYLLTFSKDIKYLKDEEYAELDKQVDEVGGKIWMLKKAVKKKIKANNIR